jgi:4-hydroxyphenylpyruvate dioxygenase-like putative hemolysin
VYEELADAYASRMPLPRFLKSRFAKEEAVLIGDPRVEGWESVSTFKDRQTAVAWRDQLRSMGVEASCVADHPLDRFGQGDIYLIVPPEQWSRASEIVDNLE